MAYDTRYGLPQSTVDYLNQTLPDISGIYSALPITIQPIRPDPDDPEGIVSLYPKASGEGLYSGSPFNPDPNRVSGPIDMKTKPMNIYNYEPGSFEDDFYNRLAEKGILEYGTSDYFPEQGGIQTLLSKLKENPIVQAGLMAINPVGTILGSIAKAFPVNERAIQEKALRQMGYSIDDIGRIVQGSGDYVTPENIMSGYNAYRMTPETFDKRIEKILNRSIPQTADSAAKIKAIQEAKQDFLDAQKLTHERYQAQVRSKYAKELAEQKVIEDAAKSRRDFQQTVADAEKQKTGGGDFAGKGSGASGPAGGQTSKENRGNRGADYSSAGKTGAKGGFGYGL